LQIFTVPLIIFVILTEFFASNSLQKLHGCYAFFQYGKNYLHSWKKFLFTFFQSTSRIPLLADVPVTFFYYTGRIWKTVKVLREKPAFLRDEDRNFQ